MTILGKCGPGVPKQAATLYLAISDFTFQLKPELLGRREVVGIERFGAFTNDGHAKK